MNRSSHSWLTYPKREEEREEARRVRSGHKSDAVEKKLQTLTGRLTGAAATLLQQGKGERKQREQKTS